MSSWKLKKKNLNFASFPRVVKAEMPPAPRIKRCRNLGNYYHAKSKIQCLLLENPNFVHYGFFSDTATIMGKVMSFLGLELRKLRCGIQNIYFIHIYESSHSACFTVVLYLKDVRFIGGRRHFYCVSFYFTIISLKSPRVQRNARIFMLFINRRNNFRKFFDMVH